MERRICVVNEFITPAHREKITAAAARLGFTVDFYHDVDAAQGHVGDCEVLYGYRAELIPQAKALRWHCCANAGVEPFLQPGLFCNEDCLLTNSAGAYGVTISEHILMVTLMLLRRMPEYSAITARRSWQGDLAVRSVLGSRVTILGTGDIGSNTARRMRALLPACVTGVNRSGKSAETAFDEVVDQSRLEEVLPRTDILVLCMPATAETVGILSRARIALLPESAIVVNVGRGSAIDQEALLEALNGEKLAGAALDVMTPEPLPQDHALWSAKNCILTPHVSGNMTLGWTCDKNVDMFLEDLEHYAAGRPLRHLVDRALGY